MPDAGLIRDLILMVGGSFVGAGGGKAFEMMIESMADLWHEAEHRVPEEHRLPPCDVAGEVAGPLLEYGKWHRRQNLLREMYVELLARALHSERQDEAHPGFANVLQQLSEDEAVILLMLKKGHQQQMPSSYVSIQARQGMGDGAWSQERLSVRLREPDLVQSKYAKMYASHLLQLGLLTRGEVTITHQSFVTRKKSGRRPSSRSSSIYLSDFGQLFAKACIPDELPDELSELSSLFEE